MHKDWCGKPCAECKTPCVLDESISCSPDCEHLGYNGEPNCVECQECDALPLFRIPICYDGSILVRAVDKDTARDLVCNMSTDILCSKSEGTWDIEEAVIEQDD